MRKLIGKHSNITALIGFRQVGLCWEQFMEYVSGGSLFNYINENYIKSKSSIKMFKGYYNFSSKF